MQEFAIFILLLAVGGVVAIYGIRFAQMYLIHSMAKFATFVERATGPEGAGQQNGLVLFAGLGASASVLLYVTGAWAAFCVAIPRSHLGSVVLWAYCTIGIAFCLGVVYRATGLALGIENWQQLDAYIVLKTKASVHNANGVLIYSCLSSICTLGFSLFFVILFALWPALMRYPYGWLVRLVN